MPKVLFIGFGYYPKFKGGSTFFQEALAKELVKNNWNVVFLTTCSYDLWFKPYLKSWCKNKVKYIELVNSPNPPLEYSYHRNPLDYIQNPTIDSFVEKVLKEEKPDLVHIHELLMFSSSITDTIKKNNISIIVTIRNMWFLCPQIYLMHKGQQLCINFEEGKKCIECLSTFPDIHISFWQRIRNGPLYIQPISKVIFQLFSRVLTPLQKRLTSNSKLSNYQLQTFRLSTQNSQPSSFPYPASFYLKRQQEMIKALNKIDVLHVSSRNIAELFISYGVKKEKIEILPWTSANLKYIKQHSLKTLNSYPIVFGYAGHQNVHKGFYVLLDAFKGCNQSKAKLVLYGYYKKDLKKELKFENLNIEFRGQYDRSDLSHVFQDIDVWIFPSIWYEPFGQIGIEALQSKVPVIGSNIGGIPSFIQDGKNGFLVGHNNVKDLYEKMNYFIQKPSLISDMQKKIKPWKTIEEFTQEIIEIYTNLISLK